jgi:hypothetical protein
MTNPWDVPPLAEIGDTDANSIFVAVGRALTEWEHVEAALGQLFAFLVGAQVSYPNNEPAIERMAQSSAFKDARRCLKKPLLAISMPIAVPRSLIACTE